MGCKHIHIEGDSKLIIDTLNNVAHWLWSIKKMKEDIHHLIQDFEEVTFTHIYRVANKSTDALAKWRVTSRCNNSWCLCIPSRLTHFVTEDFS